MLSPQTPGDETFSRQPQQLWLSQVELMSSEQVIVSRKMAFFDFRFRSDSLNFSTAKRTQAMYHTPNERSHRKQSISDEKYGS
mgnify:CR=1 FL=1